MREIKFRALKDDMSNCNFVYGYLLYGDNDIPKIAKDCGGLFITCLKGTEGQFTGLKDKNGLTDIYEGDIIDKTGKVIGNIYENNVDKGKIGTVIQGIGTEIGQKTISRAILLGCKYSE